MSAQQDGPLDLQLHDEITADARGRKSAELRVRGATTGPQVEACDRGRQEEAEIAVKTFELTQSLRAKWETPDRFTTVSEPT